MSLLSTAPLSLVVAQSTLPSLVVERASDAVAVEALIDRVFGPGRFVKTAERLREGREPVWALSFTAWSEGALVGCVRQWSIEIGGRPAIFLGPFAVDPDWRGQGLGAALVHRACEAAKVAGATAILLVGDAPYFGRLGFEAVAPGRIVMPGPVDARRVLLYPLTPEAADLQGLVTVG